MDNTGWFLSLAVVQGRHTLVNLALYPGIAVQQVDFLVLDILLSHIISPCLFTLQGRCIVRSKAQPIVYIHKLNFVVHFIHSLGIITNSYRAAKSNTKKRNASTNQKCPVAFISCIYALIGELTASDWGLTPCSWLLEKYMLSCSSNHYSSLYM